MSLLELRHVRKVYQVAGEETIAVDDISLCIEKGEFVAIMGPSGSGKSTLMHILGALDTPTSGEYVLDGNLVANLSDDELSEIRNQKIGFVFQAFNLLPRTTALRNVIVPLMYGGVARAEREARARALLTQVGLGDRLLHRSNQLSGGQQQRVAIARALAMNPSLILADEPTGNIATTQANEIMELFHSLHKEGRTIIMITHEPDIANHAERVFVIRDGVLISDTRKKAQAQKAQGVRSPKNSNKRSHHGTA